MLQTIVSFFAFLFILSASAQGLQSPSSAPLRPFAEYEHVKYMLMSAGFDYQSEAAKLKIIKNLPDDVTAIIFSTYDGDLEKFQKAVKDLNRTNIKFMRWHGAGETFWARDAMPYPVITSKGYEFVDLYYYDGFEPDADVNAFFNLGSRPLGFNFEHGNLTVNRLGDCIVSLDNWAKALSDAVFSKTYGCKRVLRLPWVSGDGGIGHVDEVVKFISDKVVITSKAKFVQILKDQGYDVHLIPEAPLPAKQASMGVMPQRSYINSLLVNDTVFVPTFGAPEDEAALAVYSSLGLKVIGVEASYLADWGGGTLHCMTMTYPDFALTPPVSK